MKLIELLNSLKLDNTWHRIKNIIIVLTLIYTSAYYINDNILLPSLKEWQASITYDSYKYVEFDLIKQGEKLNNDITDIKTTDIIKFNYYCSSYFINTYTPSLTVDKANVIYKSCKIINDLYNSQSKL